MLIRPTQVQIYVLRVASFTFKIHKMYKHSVGILRYVLLEIPTELS